MSDGYIIAELLDLGTGFLPGGVGPFQRTVELVAESFDAGKGIIDDTARKFFKGLHSGVCRIHLVANQGDVIAGGNGLFDIGTAAVCLLDRPHVKVIGQHEMLVEAKLHAQKIVNDLARERGGMICVQLRETHMAGHDGIELGHERGVGQDVVFE